VESYLISAHEAAKRLGISERHLWTLTKAGTIPHVSLGKRTLYSPDTLLAWIANIQKGNKIAA